MSWWTPDGWTITDAGRGSHPVTGRFRATRHGVRIGAHSLDAVLAMIRVRAEDARRFTTSGRPPD